MAQPFSLQQGPLFKGRTIFQEQVSQEVAPIQGGRLLQPRLA